MWGLFAEKHDRTAKLEVVFDVLVGGAEHLDGPLVERVVEALAHPQREPRVTPLHLSGHAGGLGLSPKLLFLRVILHLEQQFLAFQFFNGCVHASCFCAKVVQFRVFSAAFNP